MSVSSPINIPPFFADLVMRGGESFLPFQDNSRPLDDNDYCPLDYLGEALQETFTPQPQFTLFRYLEHIASVADEEIKRDYRQQLKAMIRIDLVSTGMANLKEFITRTDDEGQIQELVKSCEESVEENSSLGFVAYAELDRILLRYKQIEKTTFQRSPLTAGARLRLALYVETTLPKIKAIGNRLLFKADTGLKHVIQINQQERKIYVTSPKDNSQMHTFKEIHFYERFKDRYGITKLKSWCNYVTTHDQGNGENVSCLSPSMIFEKFENHLHIIYQNPTYFNLIEKIVISQDLIWGLWNMHKEGVIHADLKLNNALVKKDDIRGFAAALTDLGLAFDYANNEPPNFVITWGYYGSIEPTAPELFGNHNFTGDYRKLDVWALGMMLYQLYTGQHAKWKGILNNHYNTNFEKSEGKHNNLHQLKQAQTSLKVKIVKEIERPLAALNQKEKTAPLSLEEEFLRLIYQMLRLAPHRRITIEKAKEGIDRIVDRYNVAP